MVVRLLPLFCVLALAFFRGAIAECPPAELIEPCECVHEPVFDPRSDWVQCSNFTDMTSLQKLIDRSFDHPFPFFALKDSAMSYLSASWLTSKRVEGIIVGNSSLAAFFDEEPSTDNVVSQMYLENVRFLRGFEWQLFKSLEKLSILIIRDVELRKITKSFVENVPRSVSEIRFKGTKTIEIGDTAFQSLNELVRFELQDAQVTTFKRSMFPEYCDIYGFDVRNNLIESLPDDMFSNMMYLKMLILNGNKLTTLSGAVFRAQYVYNLRLLDVQDNPLTCDCSILWLWSHTDVPAIARGTCSEPPNMKGRDLSALNLKEFSYCPKAVQMG